MSTTGWIVLGVANIPVYVGLGWLAFKSWDEFWESVRFWITPDLFSLFRGEYIDDFWAELKLGLWIAACSACVYGESHLIDKFLG